ncbi:MAG: hypothetical protein QOF95_1822, partial [Pseudonocardiales bacterium]|nr:hypothetical protein [Pseudonocardiales bacterium]
MLPVPKRYQMGSVVWRRLAGGWLAGRYRRGEAPPADTRAGRIEEYHGRGRMVERYHVENEANSVKFDAVEELAKIADGASISMVSMALAFTLVHP